MGSRVALVVLAMWHSHQLWKLVQKGRPQAVVSVLGRREKAISQAIRVHPHPHATCYQVMDCEKDGKLTLYSFGRQEWKIYHA